MREFRVGDIVTHQVVDMKYKAVITRIPNLHGAPGSCMIRWGRREDDTWASNRELSALIEFLRLVEPAPIEYNPNQQADTEEDI